MGYASISGRARTSSRCPQAHAICDRCGARYNLVDLSWQVDWRGPILQNIRFLVCQPCYDRPQEQLRTIVLPADPVPVMNARVQDFAAASSDYRTTTGESRVDPITGIVIPGDTYRVTQNLENRTTGEIGRPADVDQNALMPGTDNAVHTGEQVFYVVPVLSINSNGSATITVTCSAPHNMPPLTQISVQGLADPTACGLFSAHIITQTAFSYETYAPVAANSLLTPTTLLSAATRGVGLPYGYEQVPQVGRNGQ